MGCQSTVVLGEYLTFSITTHDPATAVLTDTDFDPPYLIFEDEIGVPILNGTMPKLDDPGTTGFYAERVLCSAAAGFEANKSYNIYIEATVGGDTGGISYAFTVMAVAAVAPVAPAPPLSTVTGCTGKYAEAWQFIVFWCVDQMFIGTCDGVGIGDVALTDASGNFVNRGVQPSVGMVLYNTTQETYGDVTAVTPTTITASGVVWNGGDYYRIVLADALELTTVDHYLDVAATDLHAAIAAANACDCTWASWVSDYLAKLNIIDAAAYYSCSCGQPRLDGSVRDNLLTWMSAQLQMIATMQIELCDGETGSNFPTMGWAEQSHSPFQAADIIWNDILRNQ